MARYAPRLLDDELMSDIHTARRPFSWSSIAAFVVEAVAACGFVLAVYGLVVAGGIALFLHASPAHVPAAGRKWVIVLWIAAATIAGTGMTAVRSRARALARRLLPAPDPYLTLMSSVSGAVAAGPVEEALPRLAQLLADGAGAHGAGVWVAGESGLRRASSWPADASPDQPQTVASEAELRDLADVDYVAPVREAGRLLGALTLQARAGGFLALPDVRLAGDMANAAGLLLSREGLTETLRGQVRAEQEQARELAASRRRMVVAGDVARQQLSAEIHARVCEPLEHCAERVELVLTSLDGPGGPANPAALAGIAEMSEEIDAAIAAFRRIVHGVYPPVLTDHGLRAAMENLLIDVDPHGSLVSHRMPRLAARVEAGTYFCAAALLREWDGSGAQRPIRVLVGVSSSRIQVTFVDGVAKTPERPELPVSPLALETIEDRVAALGGRLQVEGDESGRWLVIEVPLAPADLVTQGDGGHGPAGESR
jgi:hypothetical protein